MNGVVKKAVVLTAGMGLRSLPATKAVPKAMLAVLDKPAVQWVCEEAARSGAREILLVVSPDGAVQKHFSKDEALERTLAVQNRLNELAAVSAIARLNVEFAVQQNAGGSGEALLCARDFVGDKPFFLLNCDDLFLGGELPACAQLSESYAVTGMSTVGAIKRNSGLDAYGVLRLKPREDGEKELLEIVEKPRDNPPSQLIAAGRYVFNPTVFEALDKTQRFGRELRLSDAIALLCRARAVCAREIKAMRFDVGSRAGLAAANAAYAMHFDKKRFLNELAEAGLDAAFLQDSRPLRIAAGIPPCGF